MEKDLSFIEFTEKLLIPELKIMITSGLHYYAFPVICQATEYMGGVYDQNKVDKFGESETRFKVALKNLYRDRRYGNNQARLFSSLRGPFIHQLRPGGDIYIASELKDTIHKDNHLKLTDDGTKMIIVIEKLLEDFELAFKKLKNEVKNRTDIDNEKVLKPYIVVTKVSSPVKNFIWDQENNVTKELESFVTQSVYI